MIKNNTCLIVTFWFGDRRRGPSIYNKDRLIYLKTQIEYLRLHQNNLKTIYFNFNIEKEHYKLLNEALKLVPEYINGSKVIINIRENKGFSYGAWNDITLKEIENYKYFIYVEDDYVFVQDTWDSYLINKYNQNPDTGYLAMGVRKNGQDKHRFLFHPYGIASSKSMKKVIDKFGSLINQPYLEKTNYHEGGDLQDVWGKLYCEVGLKNYDIRDDYRVEFALTDRPQDIWKLWWWNKNLFIKSILTIYEQNYTWWKCFDPQYQKDYKF